MLRTFVFIQTRAPLGSVTSQYKMGLFQTAIEYPPNLSLSPATATFSDHRGHAPEQNKAAVLCVCGYVEGPPFGTLAVSGQPGIGFSPPRYTIVGSNLVRKVRLPISPSVASSASCRVVNRPLLRPCDLWRWFGRQNRSVSYTLEGTADPRTRARKLVDSN